MGKILLMQNKFCKKKTGGKIEHVIKNRKP